jgi:hypothetical protein
MAISRFYHGVILVPRGSTKQFITLALFLSGFVSASPDYMTTCFSRDIPDFVHFHLLIRHFFFSHKLFIMFRAEIHNSHRTDRTPNLQYLTRNFQFRLTHLIFCSFAGAEKAFST